MTSQKIDDLQIGKAGEYLVCSDLILRGYIAFPSEQGLPYDVVADINGKLTKIQVKTTRTVRPIPQRKTYTPAYLFHIKRCGKNGSKLYQVGDYDIMALVALDTKKIGYLQTKNCKKTMHLDLKKMELLTFESAITPVVDKVTM